MLGRGQLYGRTRRRVDCPDATLTETVYAPGSQLRSHAHELPNFVLVVRGSFDETFGRRARSCGERELYFRPAGELHAQRFGLAEATCLTIELPEDYAPRLVGALRSDDPMQGVPTLLAMRLYDEICRTTSEAGLAVEELVPELCASASGRREVREKRRPRWLDVVRSRLDAEHSQTIRLHDLARDIGVHRVHLSRTFVRFFGCSIAQYVRRQRVHAACARLRADDGPVSTIAAAVGFSDESHMGRAFREILGSTPHRYRSRVLSSIGGASGSGSITGPRSLNILGSRSKSIAVRKQ